MAAAKYNMIPEDYDIWDEDMCLGDYPKFTPITYPARDPWYEWDNEAARENYGEPVRDILTLVRFLTILCRFRYPWVPSNFMVSTKTTRQTWFSKYQGKLL